MTEPIFSNRFVIAEYRWKYYIYVAVCWTLVFAGFMTFSAKTRTWQFWMAEVVLTCFALGLTYMLSNSKYKFIGRKGPAFDEYMENRYKQMLGEDGVFDFETDHFVLHDNEKEVKVKWAEVTKISAHLQDSLTWDDLCLRLEYDGSHFLEVNEEIAGWMKFVSEVHRNFPTIPADWQDVVIHMNKEELLLFPI
jgi:hypothetical protein